MAPTQDFTTTAARTLSIIRSCLRFVDVDAGHFSTSNW